jgi:hypothetical protein
MGMFRRCSERTVTQTSCEVWNKIMFSHPSRLSVFMAALCVSLTGWDVLAAEGQQHQLKTYYVSPSGSDAAAGGPDSPWRSVQHAADSVSPGDRVYIRSGAYAERVVFKRAGEAGAPTVFSAGPGERVTLKGLELAKGVAHLNIANLTIAGFKVWGVSLEGNNHDITLSGLTVKGGEAGIHLTSGESGSPPENGPVSDVIVENSLIRDSAYTAVDCTPGPCTRMIFRHLEITGAGRGGDDGWGADGLAIERGKDIVVEDSHIHDNSGDGIDLDSRDTAGHVSGIVVRRNTVIRNHRNGIKLWAGGRMENNAIWGQGDAAVVLGDWPGTYQVVNNTIAYNMQDAAYSNRNYALVAAYPNDETGLSACMELTLRHNIFAFNSSAAVGGSTGLYLGKGVRLAGEGHNLFWSQKDNEIVAEFVAPEREFSRSEISGGGWAAATGQGTGDIAADPLFVAGWPKVDLRLRKGSPAMAIKAGAAADVLSARPRKARRVK